MKITRKQIRQLIREAVEEGVETRERVDFHGLMDILGVSSGDMLSRQWDYSMGVKASDGKVYEVYINDNEDGTWDINAPTIIFAALGDFPTLPDDDEDGTRAVFEPDEY